MRASAGARRMNDQGVTLVELAVILTVLVVLGALGIPSFLGMIPRIKLNDYTMVLANEISVTRVRAIAKSLSVKITFDPGNPAKDPDEAAESYTVWQEREDGGWDSYGTNRLQGINLVSTSGLDLADTIVADSTGVFNVPLDTVATILLQTPGGEFQKMITVEPTGRLFVSRRQQGGGWTRE